MLSLDGVAFVALAGIVGLLLVPWFLRRLSVAAEEELTAKVLNRLRPKGREG